jgi:hypothetical protein
MDGIHGPFYPRPIVPVGPSETHRTGPQRFKGKVVGVRPDSDDQALHILSRGWASPPC